MGKKCRVIFIALLVAVLGMFAWVVLFPHEREPFYQGKPLSYWLAGYDETRTNDHPTGWMAGEAVRHVGTNAIPTLLRMLQKTDSPLKLKLLALSRKQHFFEIPYTSATAYGHEGGVGFRELGPLASNAVPELIRIYNRHLSPWSQYEIAWAFSYIGPHAKAAVPSLLREFTNTDRIVRYSAVSALGGISAEPRLVVPSLIKCLNDPDTMVQASAVIVLGG